MQQCKPDIFTRQKLGPVILLAFACAVFALAMAQKSETARNRTGSKITVSSYGIVRVYRDGLIDCRPWSGARTKWQIKMTPQDVLSGQGNILYLLSKEGLFQFNLAIGPSSLREIICFKKSQRYLQIVGIAKRGVWLLRPGVAVDLFGDGKIIEHYDFLLLPAPPKAKELRRLQIPIPLYGGMVGGCPYLAMNYGQKSYGYLIYDKSKRAWEGHFIHGTPALMPLVSENDRFIELTGGDNIFSCRSSVKGPSEGSVQYDGLSMKLSPHLFLTGFVGVPSKRQGIVAIDTSTGKVVFHFPSKNLARKGVYVHQKIVWAWNFDWSQDPELVSFPLPSAMPENKERRKN